MEPTQEQWRPVVGYEGCYEVSDRGRVRTVPRMVAAGRGAWRHVPQRIRRQAVTNAGYNIVTLSRSQLTTKLVHTLVLEAFVGPRPVGMEACHYDGDKTNNILTNLRWDTKKANEADAVRVGARPDPNRTHCGRGHLISDENTYVNARGIKECRDCKVEVLNRYKDGLLSGNREIRHRIDPARTHCTNGHALTEENIFYNGLGRSCCRECRRTSQLKYRANRAGARERAAV